MATFEPWSRSSRDAAAEERRMSRLFGAVTEPEPLPEVARERVRRRLQGKPSRAPGLVLLRLVAVGVVIGIAGAAAAQWTALRLSSPKHEHVSAPQAPQALAPQPVLPRRTPNVVAPPAPATEPVEAAPNAADASPRGASAPPAALPSSRLGLEAASLEAALRALRGGAAERARQAIERHLQEFPNGALELEARVAHVDALLALGRRQDARRELWTLPLNHVGRKQELRLIRAELTADSDCGKALGDFQVLNAEVLPPAWAERALFGRGACLLQLGDRAAAERDFARYLEKYPSGRFAAQIRQRAGH